MNYRVQLLYYVLIEYVINSQLMSVEPTYYLYIIVIYVPPIEFIHLFCAIVTRMFPNILPSVRVYLLDNVVHHSLASCRVIFRITVIVQNENNLQSVHSMTMVSGEC